MNLSTAPRVAAASCKRLAAARLAGQHDWNAQLLLPIISRRANLLRFPARRSSWPELRVRQCKAVSNKHETDYISNAPDIPSTDAGAVSGQEADSHWWLFGALLTTAWPATAAQEVSYDPSGASQYFENIAGFLYCILVVWFLSRTISRRVKKFTTEVLLSPLARHLLLLASELAIPIR